MVMSGVDRYWPVPVQEGSLIFCVYIRNYLSEWWHLCFSALRITYGTRQNRIKRSFTSFLKKL